MEAITSIYRRLDDRITRALQHWSIPALRVCLGINFFWFGFLKFFPGMSPAEELAGRTMETMSLGLVSAGVFLPILATWETLIGVGLIVGKWMRAVLFLLWLQMLGAMSPLFLFPDETFAHFPYAPNLEGQYIIKNLVLITASLVVGATVRGARIRENEEQETNTRVQLGDEPPS